MGAKLTNFWTEDSDGERWMINQPALVVATTNRPRRKGKTKMYTNRPKHGTKAWMSYIRGLRRKTKSNPRRRKAAKRNMYSAGEVANRPRTRTVTRTRTVHIRARRNSPSASRGLLGSFGFPGMEQIAGAFGGLVVPPVLGYFTSSYVPDSIKSSAVGRYGIQGLLTIGPAWIVRKYVNRSVGNTMLVVGIGKLLFDMVREFAPGIPGLSGMRGQPFLGAYVGQRAGFPALRSVPQMTTPMLNGVPDRLNPNARF